MTEQRIKELADMCYRAALKTGSEYVLAIRIFKSWE